MLIAWLLKFALVLVIMVCFVGSIREEEIIGLTDEEDNV